MRCSKPTHWLAATLHNPYPLAILAKGLTEIVQSLLKDLVLFSLAGRDRPP